MNPKADPYAAKLHKRIDALLFVFTVIIIAMVLRSSARGGTPLFSHTLPLAQQPFWTTLSIFTWQSNDKVALVPYQSSAASAENAVALAGLFSEPETSFSPIMAVENRKPTYAVAPELNEPNRAKSFSALSSRPSLSQISGFGSALTTNGAAVPTFRTGAALAGTDSRDTSTAVASSIDTAPRYAGESGAAPFTPSTSGATSQASQPAIASADNAGSSYSLQAVSAPAGYALPGPLETSGLKASAEHTTHSIRSEPLASGQQGWDGGGGTGNWSNNTNWGNDSQPSYGTLFFDDSNNGQTTMTDDNITSMNQLNWSGTQAWRLNQGGSTVLSLYDNGGTQAKIENYSTGLVTINLPITFAANNGSPPNPFGEINAVNGNITFGSGTLTVNGASVNGIKLFGSNHTTTFNNTVSASGKWFGLTGATTTMAIGGTFTSGDIYVMNGGTLQINSGATVTSSAIRLGGDFGNTGNQNQTLGGTLQFASLTGGQTFGSVINSVSGNTSGTLLIDSLNTSGTNTLSAASYLDSALRTQVAAGGTLLFQGGSVDVKAQTLTISGSGNTIINEALSSSLAAGGSLVKTGSGTLIIQSTGNNYTGTNNGSLNANGTQISGGVLGIHGDTSLGLAPAGAYNSIQFTGSGTLQDTNSDINLNANRNILIGNTFTATLDSNGNNFTINGVISDTSNGGSLTKIGSGTVKLNNAANSYTSVTTISAGILEVVKLASGGSNSSIGNSSGGAANLVIDGGTLKYTGSGDSTGRNFTIGPNGATIDSSGSGALNFTSSTGQTVSGTGNRTFTLTGSNTGANTLNGGVGDPTTGATSLVKDGAGSWTIARTSSYTGATLINNGTLTIDAVTGTTAGNLSGTASITVNGGGTLLLSGSASNTTRINNSATMVLNGGTFNAGGLSEGSTSTVGIGALTLSSNSTIDLLSTSLLHFADSSGSTWAGTLSIYNWDGTLTTGGGSEQILFGTSISGLTSGQLAQIEFVNPAGFAPGTYGAIFATSLNGEIVPTMMTPVPEPSTWAAAALALGAIAWTQLRKGSRAARRRFARRPAVVPVA